MTIKCRTMTYHKSKEKTRLANTRISNEQKLEKIITAQNTSGKHSYYLSRKDAITCIARALVSLLMFGYVLVCLCVCDNWQSWINELLGVMGLILEIRMCDQLTVGVLLQLLFGLYTTHMGIMG